MTPGVPLALVNKLPYLNNLIELYVLLEGAFHIVSHDLVHFIIINAVKVEFYGDQILNNL